MIIPVLVFVSVVLFAAGLYLWLVPSRTQRRVQALGPSLPDSSWQATWVKVSGPLASLSMPEGEWAQSPLHVLFLQAGIRHESARLGYFGAKTVLPLLLGGGCYLVLNQGQLSLLPMMLSISVAGLAGVYLPNLVVHGLARARRAEVLEHFPDATDLLVVCLEAGLGLDAALNRVADELRTSSPALSEELQLTNLEIRAGTSREQALHHLTLRSGVEEIRTFAVMVKQADRFGTSIGDALRVYADELRHKRMIRAEELAARIPTKLLVPLVLCIFPSILMVVLGPAALRILRQLLPMMSGQA